MNYIDTDPTVLNVTDTETLESGPLTPDQLPEFNEVYQKSFTKLTIRAKTFRELRDPEGTTNEAFIKAMGSWDKYTNMGHSHETWISRILYNTAISEIRKTRIIQEELSLNADDAEEYNDSIADPNVDADFDNVLDSMLDDDDVRFDRLMEHVKDLLKDGKKPDYWYEMIVLRDRDFTHKEIADKLNISLGSVASGLSRASKFLGSDTDLRALLKTNSDN